MRKIFASLLFLFRQGEEVEGADEKNTLSPLLFLSLKVEMEAGDEKNVLPPPLVWKFFMFYY